ncbi:hypothetical protein SCUCBS95973_006544 [Sporothrix curviconia]|uniref:Alcohol dehydrogenase iron-type/glycerol dehydrogenase GldA domain-containing protein n=1 Tax=Sporothrix curviconia TaxID=1260050 RepID=A0ABP0C5Y6_9PEZI
MTDSVLPVSGIYEPHGLRKLYYGPNVVEKHLLHVLPSSTSKAFIVTGASLAAKTPLVKRVQDLLGTAHHGGTFSQIRQHAPVEQVARAIDDLCGRPDTEAVISIGGGSPIDAAKTLSKRFHAAHGRYLVHIAIPTTLSAAECTDIGGTTMQDGVKQGVRGDELAPQYIFYDASFALHTPPALFMSTGIRAMDHALELQYNPAAAWLPVKAIALQAIATLYRLLPRYRDDPTDEHVILGLFLAAYGSLGFFGKQMRGSLGLSHTIGYALGSPYGIPHGITSCLTLGHVVALKAELDPADAACVAGTLPCFGKARSGDDVADSRVVGAVILQLVRDLGLYTTLTEHGVPGDQLDVICDRALGSWMPGEERDLQDAALRAAVRRLVACLF